MAYLKVKHIIISALGLLLVAGGLAGCGNKQSADSTKGYKNGTITIPAKNGSICGAPNYIAYEKGFFKKNGIKANLVAKPTNIADLEAGFASGKYDALNGDFQYLPAIQNGAQIQAAGGIHQGCIQVLVPKNSSIKSVKDLKDKTIATPGQGSTPQFVASIALQHAGIDPKTGVTWKTYDYDLLAKAAQKGQVDAIGNVDPYAYQAIKEDHFRVIVDNNNHAGNNEMAKMGMKKDGSCCYLYLADKLTKQNPKKAKAIVKAYQEAADWINKHPQQTASILLNKKYVSSSKFVNQKNVSNLIASYHFGLKKSKGKADVTYYANQLKQAGFLKSDTNVKQLVNKAYYDG
ncbi:ABC transporter [Lentilactobacillus hilgardii]|uniref:NMT1/THI5-like protein n=2 Tax=Lentilactobacillus hilgardii TaxID=1588 RepID=C0XIW3_LENH9|nr:NMT1/THI5-like protein [Lentilactobacillus hilgardii DSM 20176 = ATCC 8290]EEI72539.1 NMT1/THI5-like protein [Lentilactobacillus hilgardii ATCC 27305]MBZ2202044.1 ABC transporter [Lentilactobacillus hilgardii]RRG11514.1 MAG: ABC transporter substrate-binding protein [Lactobacillus sp.]KRK53715.1 Abc1 like protein [Lentilactobacillus hilgardii DSM 20176 = ATCC 8290]